MSFFCLRSDIVKNDGIYSKYLFSFPGSGRYSLKAHVQANRTIVPQTAKLWSHAMYIPGYVENGKVKQWRENDIAIYSNTWMHHIPSQILGGDIRTTTAQLGDVQLQRH